uniref:Uncharacterized protein n=2 Tax=Anguilla anguilla TaxID=7936 RepID=A0A0E9P9L0_ANGAN
MTKTICGQRLRMDSVCVCTCFNVARWLALNLTILIIPSKINKLTIYVLKPRLNKLDFPLLFLA